MVEDFRESRKAGVRKDYVFDVCVIGAGAAGSSLARRLMPTGLTVGLLESGGRDHDPRVQSLSGGERSGLDYYELDHVNLRFFGGTTAVWGGRCARLNAIDFERRPWVPYSGWPFGVEELEPYYKEAMACFGLREEAPVERGTAFDPDRVRADRWWIDEGFDRFGWHRAGDLRASPKVCIVLGATVVRLETDGRGERIARAELASPEGAKGGVRAKAFVLCAGGIETPRLLLASRGPHWPDGLGNRRGLVGRFFMEHPHGRGARLRVDDSEAFFRRFPRFFKSGGHSCGRIYRPGEALQAEAGLLNSGFTIAVRRHPGEREAFYKQAMARVKAKVPPNAGGRMIWKGTRLAGRWSRKLLGDRPALRKLRQPEYGIYAILRAEQAPNPESRLRLTERTDAVGMPRIHLDWRFGDLEKRSAAAAMRALDAELRRLALGRAELEPWLTDADVTWRFDPLASNHAFGGYHHMGTTRMGANERVGVCDADCRVFGLDNLFLAGSGVFPTGGWANPTLTLVALALRTGDRLGRELAANELAFGK